MNYEDDEVGLIDLQLALASARRLLEILAILDGKIRRRFPEVRS